MTTLTVHLHRITNLTDQAHYDEADPYVKFELEQDNVIFDKDFGEMVSSKKKNEQNPVYSEDFKFKIPTLNNMVLTCTVLDDDWGKDDVIGRCRIKLEDLDLSTEPLEVRRKVDNNILRDDAWIFLKVSWGEPTEDEDATNLSHVGKAAYECLRTKHPEHHGQLWNVTSGRIIGELHQTPKEAWPGGPTHPDGHDDWFPEAMGNVLSKTKIWADVCSLGPPDGRFLTSFKNALATIAESAAEREKPVIVRMMFGNIIGMPVNCNGVRDELTADLPNDANIQLWVGAWRNLTSWNHSKIIAVDGQYLHTGGHNLWDAHYLSFDPVHDLSLELEGKCAYDGHNFANRQWDFIESNQETFWGTIGSAMPDHLPQVSPTRVTVSEWPKGVASEHAPMFRSNLVRQMAQPIDDAIPIITVGRHGNLVENDRPSDDAFVAMMNSATTVIRAALQDIGPVCVPNTKIALPGTGWPRYLSVLGKAIWERGVDVEIVLSNPASIPAGLSPTEGMYGNGWDCNDIAAEIIKTIKEQFPDAEDDDLRQKVADNLRICFIRQCCGNKYEDGATMGLHSKHFIVDDRTLYIGSQNLYVCDLAEWGVLIDDKETVAKMMDEYWNPMWEHSFTNEDVDVQAVMDGLVIDRNGADPSEVDDDMRETMKKAEMANAGHASLDMYEHDED